MMVVKKMLLRAGRLDAAWAASAAERSWNRGAT